MIIIDGEEHRLGIALSGGGFRAAAFHLGLFDFLKKKGLLWDVDVVSCVSGGSIAGAFLASRWIEKERLDYNVFHELEEFLTLRSLDVSSILKGLFCPSKNGLAILADGYDKYLFGGRTLGDLSQGPRLYLNTTNLKSGNMFSFICGGGEQAKAEMGDWELGWAAGADFSLARAVAASSAFPPFFSPLILSEDTYRTKKHDKGYVSLTDGGVYDNLGLNPMISSDNGLGVCLVSDGGKPFVFNGNPSRNGLAVLMNIANIQMEQIRGLKIQQLKAKRLESETLKAVCWWSLDSSVQGKEQTAAQLAQISTRLRRLKPGQLAALREHGHHLAEIRWNKYVEGNN